MLSALHELTHLILRAMLIMENVENIWEREREKEPTLIPKPETITVDISSGCCGVLPRSQDAAARNVGCWWLTVEFLSKIAFCERNCITLGYILSLGAAQIQWLANCEGTKAQSLNWDNLEHPVLEVPLDCLKSLWQLPCSLTSPCAQSCLCTGAIPKSTLQ